MSTMENIKWIHWFWITILCVLNFQYGVVISYPLHTADNDGNNTSIELILQNNTKNNSSTLLLHRIDKIFMNITADEIIMEKKTLTNETQLILQNIPKSNANANIEINNYNKSESINSNDTQNINANNSNTDLIFGNVSLAPKHNRTDVLDINQNIGFKDESNITRTRSTNLPSIQLQRDSVNISNMKKEITSQEDKFDIKFIEKVTSKSIKNDSNFTSTSTEDLSVAEVQDNLTNLDNFINSKRRAKGLSSEYRSDDVKSINYSITGKNLLIRSAESVDTIKKAHHDEGNVSSEALSYKGMDAGLISGICFATFALCCGIATSGLIFYRRRHYLNKPHALSEPDSGYIDDSIIRDTNSDELYSLDNDSFLNSLEAMTIQNYWSETVKHTKL